MATEGGRLQLRVRAREQAKRACINRDDDDAISCDDLHDDTTRSDLRDHTTPHQASTAT